MGGRTRVFEFRGVFYNLTANLVKQFLYMSTAKLSELCFPLDAVLLGVLAWPRCRGRAGTASEWD